MIIYPAIDIKGGCAVRLNQGKFDEVTDYGDPVAAAVRWQDEGAEYIHVVDLDGALEGVGANLDIIRTMVNTVDIPIQLGGGIRTYDDIQIRLEEIGVERVILGTLATSNPELVRDVCERWPGRIVLGLDIRNGVIAVRGWSDDSDITPADLLLAMEEAGVNTVVFTDITRDGLLSGPNVEMTRNIITQCNMGVIGSGGISSLTDLRKLGEAGCAGAILGRALYTGAFTLREALENA